MHDGRRQYVALFEYDAIFAKNLNPGLIRGLKKGLGTFWEFFNSNLSIFQCFFRYLDVNYLNTPLQTIFIFSHLLDNKEPETYEKGTKLTKLFKSVHFR